MLVIGLSGKMGSGKDFIAKHFIHAYLKKHFPQLDIVFLSFADVLKMQVLEKYSNTSWDEVYPPEYIPKTEHIRKLLQFEGNLMRETDPKYWIRLFDNWARLMQRKGCHILIVADVRFPLEQNYILHDYKGMVCKVSAPQRTYHTHDSKLMKDVSECALDSINQSEYDYVFHNDIHFTTLEEAEERFKPFIEQLEKKVNKI